MVAASFGTLAFVLALLHITDASQLRNDPQNPFVAYGNGTKFDISDVFTYPVQIANDVRGYMYWWNPSNYSCRGSLPAAICQKADQYYNCGTTNTVWLLQQYNPLIYQIQYTFGQEWRITVITFQEDETILTPTIEFVSEQPYLQYNFLVKGKCIGQPKWECQQREVSEETQRWFALHNTTQP